MTRPHHADEFALGIGVREDDALYLDRAVGLHGGRRLGLAAGKKQQRGQGE
jgi:hypothetical protein